MTDEMRSLRAMLVKAPDADFLREMIGFTYASDSRRLVKLVGWRKS